MSTTSHQAAEQVKQQVAQMPQAVLDVIAENVKGQHIGDQVPPAAVQEH